MRTFPKLAAITVASMAIGAAAAYAQTAAPQSQTNCGIETYSVDKQAYVTVPCTGEQATSQTSKAPGQSNCGIETYSVDKQAYVSTPCAAGTTYENPSGKSSENLNTK